MNATRLVCLRCDWSGAADGPRCPRCGVAVFRADPPRPGPRRPVARVPASRPANPEASSRRSLDARIPIPTDVPVDDDRPDDVGDPRRRTRRPRVVAAAAVLVALALGGALWGGPGGDAERPSPPIGRARQVAPPLTGTLVYARGGDSDGVQLWTWDLAAGVVTGGPLAPRPLDLVGLAGVDRGVVGITWRAPNGGMRAGVLPTLDRDARIRRIMAADLVSWGARGGAVSAVTTTERGGCGRVVVDGFRLQTELREPALTAQLCGRVLSIGRAGAVTYLSVLRGDDVSVVYPGIGSFREVLPDHGLASVSWASDMIVLPFPRPAARVPLGRDVDLALAETAAGQAPAVVPAAYFSQGFDRASPPVRYGTDDEPFLLERVLAWSPDSFEALALGTLGARRGVYRLDTLPGDGVDVPGLVIEGSGDAWATYTRAGSAVVTIGYRVYVVTDGLTRELPGEPGVPLPDGPMTWIP